ncbi:MAG: T9SS type A sorting domain-containing protein [Bacteroidota bacterium]
MVFIFAACISTTLLHAQTAGVSLQTIANYNQWGWNAVALQNGFITIAAVPAIGGRIMQYNLGSLQSIFINPDTSLLGKTFTPAPNGQWHNFGGYKTLPAPQEHWNVPGNWPPPPSLDYGAYTITDTIRTNDSVSVEVASPVEQWTTPEISFIRKATLYTGTSRVKMDQTIVNNGTDTLNWSVWSITPSIVHHPNTTDYQNYWVYFPINPNSVYGQSGVSPQGASNAWKGEIASGVYGIQYTPDNTLIYSDPDNGWIAYADLSDAVVFARTFDIFEGTHYPDSARVTVYVSSPSPLYMEVEVKSPIVELAPGGGKYTFTENWWAAKVQAPILEVNSIGAIARRLSYNPVTQILSSTCGIFYEGIAQTVFLDVNRQILSEGRQHNVSPLNEIQLQDTTAIPNETKTVEIQVHNVNGDLIGVLDSADVSQLLTDVIPKTPALPLEYHPASNYPNPFNPSTTISFTVLQAGPVSLKVFDLMGRQVAELMNRTLAPGTYNTSFDGSHLSSGVYFYRLETGSIRETHKLVLIK